MTDASRSVPALQLEGLTKRFGKRTALDGVSFAVPACSLVVLLGPAGAGKTTTLRLIAGLDPPDGGQILIQGEDAAALEPKDRDVALIFDNLALYPNKTGFENIASPLRIRRAAESEIAESVTALAGVLRIAHVLHRLPRTMSGGERQRVALGRALVRKPRVFLLDEPLSSLDAMLRIELRAELKRLQREQGHSFLLATPDFAEAMAIADTVVVLREGKVVQIAEPQSLYDEPVDRGVARFVGAPDINILPIARVPGTGEMRIAGAMVTLPPRLSALIAGRSTDAEAGLRPEHVHLAPPDGAELRGRVSDIEPLGLKSVLTLSNDEGDVRMVADTALARTLQVGDTIGATIDADHLLVFDRATGIRLTGDRTGRDL